MDTSKITAKQFMIQKNVEHKNQWNGDEINPIYLNNKYLESFMEDYAQQKTLQLKSELDKAVELLKEVTALWVSAEHYHGSETDTKITTFLEGK